MKCQHDLTSFGIPRAALPVTLEGQMLTDQHMTWLRGRRQIEATRASMMDLAVSIEAANVPYQTASRNVVGLMPRPEDVLFGRGKMVVEHPGNTRFRQVVDLYMSKYEVSGRLEKTCIAEIIVRMVKENSGCFLKKDDGGDYWEEVDDAIARKKVAHAFRNRRKLHGLTEKG